jgi:hypothetical protein
MRGFLRRAGKVLLPVAVLLAASSRASGQQAFTRHFVAATEERYRVTLNIKAESHSVTIETIAAQTYVTPVVKAAAISLRWSAIRQVLTVQNDGTAHIEQTDSPAGPCETTSQPPGQADVQLQASLNFFCLAWARNETIRYSEDVNGQLIDNKIATLPPLDEGNPQLLSLWLLHAVRPSVIFPALKFEIGKKVHQSFQPAGALMKNAHGSQTTEWLDAEGEVPATTLHVVQQLLWAAASDTPGAKQNSSTADLDKEEDFFADSITTLSLQDGSVLHASRNASRTISRHIEPVSGLPQPPDFSSKLTLSVNIERLP